MTPAVIIPKPRTPNGITNLSWIGAFSNDSLALCLKSTPSATPTRTSHFNAPRLETAVGKAYLYDETEVEVNGVFMGPLQDSGTFVWMNGGKSKDQAGVVGSIMSHVKMFRDKSQYSSQHVVLRRDGGGFSQPGDSGAWVISEQGKWVGMVLGGNSKVQPPRTYISSTTFILDAIESRIGIRPSVPAPTRWLHPRVNGIAYFATL